MIEYSKTFHEELLVEALQNRLRGKVKKIVMDELSKIVDEYLRSVTVETIEQYSNMQKDLREIYVTAKVIHEG